MTKWTAKDMAYRPGGLSQSEQELVAWSRNLSNQGLDVVDRILMQQALNALEYHTAQTRPIANTDEVIKALRARLAQPEQEWQGLTDEEQMQVAWSCGAMSADWLDFARAIEAKLKEKNA